MLSMDAMRSAIMSPSAPADLEASRRDRLAAPMSTETSTYAHQRAQSHAPSQQLSSLLLSPQQEPEAAQSGIILPPPPYTSSHAFSPGIKRKRAPSAAVDHTILPTPQPRHPYLSGNFAPIYQTLPLTPCAYSGRIPPELAGGQYVRNGSNPVTNQDLGRDAHWFDGDGMLAGVSFRRATALDPSSTSGEQQEQHPPSDPATIIPEFVNAFVQTDLYLNAVRSPHLKTPILPSIATLVDPLASFLRVTLRVLRTLLLVLLSHLPGSPFAITRISVANTNLVYHDGRALATCESGPPMRVQLPGLETVGWYDGCAAQGEEGSGEGVGSGAGTEKMGSRWKKQKKTKQTKLGGEAGGLLGFMREWTTAHPKVDPVSKEMLLFHSSFAPPYVQYSVIPDTRQQQQRSSVVDDEKSALSLYHHPLLPPQQPAIINADVPGIASAKMMHDFGVSHRHTVILDLPLSLDPTNQLAGRPPVTYDATQPSRFGVFPRRRPQDVRWFETDAACIFHTANTWDVPAAAAAAVEDAPTAEVNLLACRLTSATLVFAAGNIAPPVERPPPPMMTRGGTALRRRRMPFFSAYDPQNEKAVIEGDAAVAEKKRMSRRTKVDRSSSSSSFSNSTALSSAHNCGHDNADLEPLLSSSSSILCTPATDAADLPDDLEAFLNAEECRLYYYAFDLARHSITHQWALAAIPFEFPAVRPDREMQAARYIYGCSTTATTAFGSALGKATKIDALVKVDAGALIQRGRERPPRGVTGCVDGRSMEEVLLQQQLQQSRRQEVSGQQQRDPISVFVMPDGWFAQEMRFVPSADPAEADREDAGYLLFYAFDETQLAVNGDVPDDADAMTRARSELWVLDARDMREVVCRVALPQRVPYGLHGAWFTEEMIRAQRGVERFREGAAGGAGDAEQENRGVAGEMWRVVREAIEVMLA